MAFQHSWGRVDRLLGVLEQLQVPLGEARSSANIPGMKLPEALNFRDKARMKDCLRAAGLPVARHRLVQSAADALALAEEVGFPLILKPVAGVGARSTWRIREEAELVDLLAQLQPSPAQPIQAEEFITGVERTLEAVMVEGRPQWWSGTRYHPTPLAVLENGWMQYTVILPREEVAPWADFAPVSIAALRALGLSTGLSHMEWFERADGSFVIGEVGARPPGVNIMPMMSLVHGVDMVERWCRLMTLGEWSPTPRRRAAGTAFFRGQGRGSRVVAVHGLDQAQQEVGALVVDRKLPVVGQPVSTSYEGEGWAIVAADSTVEVEHALARLVRLVRVELG
jgi:biotin carboxylase